MILYKLVYIFNTTLKSFFSSENQYHTTWIKFCEYLFKMITEVSLLRVIWFGKKFKYQKEQINQLFNRSDLATLFMCLCLCGIIINPTSYPMTDIKLRLFMIRQCSILRFSNVPLSINLIVFFSCFIFAWYLGCNRLLYIYRRLYGIACLLSGIVALLEQEKRYK